MLNDILYYLHAELEKHRSTFSYAEGILVITKIEMKKTSHMIGFVQSQEKTIYLKTWDIQKENNNLSLIINEAITLASSK